MKVQNRPYAGNWSEDFLNKYRTTRSWTPDAIVTFNGETTLPGCPTCKNKIDFSKFINSVNVSGGLDGSNSCDIQLKIPWAYGDSVYKDGKFILVSGIEVFVYYRGFFQVKDLALKADNIDLENNEVLSAPDAEIRPYYPVFHGVISQVSVDLSDGAYSVGIQTRNMLSFWDNQQINTQQGYFAADPTMSRGSINLRGHVYTGMTPHQVIYDLYLDAGGSAEGTGFAYSKQSNVKARSSTGPQLYSLMMRYLEQRFKNGMYGLRMYGASGRMYSVIETQIIANKQVTKTEKSAEFKEVIVRQNKPYSKPKSKEKSFSRLVKAGMIAFEHNNATRGRVQRTIDTQYLTQITETDQVGLNVLSMKPFVPDLGSFGSVEFFESQMESKKSIADRVCEATGYEFYQDMDGDLVFKPPMYNMDTSGDRVYNIYREDIISISFSHAEPEATYVTMKGNHFRNFEGHGLTGEWGVKGVYVDYALVAKYGWKGQDFDSSFYNTARQAYYAAAVELDKQNKNTEGCDVTIPLRPELKPGYPVYLEENDCFYYVESVNHSFSYGGSCTTSLTLNCQRKKFIPPGDASVKYRDDPSRAVDLGRTELPERYIYRRYDRTDEGSRPINAQSNDADIAYRKITGFPNVVMAFDHQNASPSMLHYQPDFQSIGKKGTKERVRYRNMIINEGIRLGVLNYEEGGDVRNGPFYLWVPVGGGKPPQKVSLPLVNGEIAGTETLRSVSEKSRLAGEKAAKRIGKGGKAAAVQKAREAEAQRQENLQNNIQKAVGSAGVYPNLDNSNQTSTATILDLIYLIQSSLGRGENTSPLQNLMSALQDKKSSFVPKAQGYFRYYSSSHPSPEHQGPELGEYIKTNSTSDPELIFNDNVPDTVRDNVVQAVPDGDGDTVMFGNSVDNRQQIVRGLLTKTMYSNGLEYVPTKDITALSFQVSANFTVSELPGPSVEVSDVWYQRSYRPGTEWWQKAYVAVKRKLASKAVKLSLDTPVYDLFQFFDSQSEDYIEMFFVPTVFIKHNVGNWGDEATTEYYSQGEPITRDMTDTIGLLNILDPQGNPVKSRKSLAQHFASIFLFKLREMSKAEFPNAYNVEEWVRLGEVDNDAGTLDPQEQLLSDLRGYVNGLAPTLGIPESNTLKVTRTKLTVQTKRVRNRRGKTKTVKDQIVTPIFPISDSKGYEVFGAYQYGRGLRPARGTLFDAILKQDPTRIFTESEITTALKNLDKSKTQTEYRESLKELYLEKMSSINPQERERLIASLGLDGEIRENEKLEVVNNLLANRLMTRSDEQVITNIPSAMAEIYPQEDGNEVCQCRIHSTDAILLEGALDLDNFLEIENPLLRSVRNQSEQKAIEWREHQSALRGENLTRPTPGQGSFATSNSFGSGFDFNNRGNNRLLNSFTRVNENNQLEFNNPFAGAVSSTVAGAEQLSDQAKAIKAATERVGGDDNE